MMTKTIPRNDSTKQLNEIVDEIYHVKDPLSSPSRDRQVLEYFELKSQLLLKTAI